MRKKALVLAFMFMAILATQIAMSAKAEETVSDYPIDQYEAAEGYAEVVWGTYFEVVDSTYLNVTVTSSVAVNMSLESIPRIVSFVIEGNGSETLTSLAFTGFVPCTTYYRHQDGYLIEEFTTDSSGGYAYTQDISVPHHVYILEYSSTLYITSDYTFTSDIYQPIVVEADNIVIDGNGYTLQGPGSGYGFYLPSRSNVTIKDATVKGWSVGIWLYYSSSNSISGNSITANNVYGIMLHRSFYNSIAGNNLTANHSCIGLYEQSGSNSIDGNNITNSRGGVYLHSSSSNITGNNITANIGYGIMLGYASSNSISGNNITNNYEGMRIVHSGCDSITGNNITNSYYGIFLSISHSDSIAENNITNNQYGIMLYLSSGTTFYHNNIINNAVQVADISPGAPAYNDWHHPDLLEGNYWSDYPGVDDGSGTGKHSIAGDGIGDTDIPWPAANYDYYPFIHESGWIVPVDTTPPVTTISLSGTLGLEGWYISDVTVTLTATDDISGVAETAYSFDEATWIMYTEPFTITTEGIITVCYNSTDNAGNMEATRCETIKIDKTPPAITITTPTDYGLYAVGVALDFSATDAASGVSTVVGDLTCASGESQEVNSGFEPCLGVYILVVTAQDNAGNTAESTSVYFVVYDPDGGFVTGGGWIDSPTGAYTPDPTLAGKASFGFVSKYKKGASTPKGQTEFIFHVADLNFHSSSYQWLVIAGPRVQFKGSGTINGAGNYGFMLTAIDGQVNGGGGVDRFRIKIWDKATGTVVYDNQLDDADNAGVTDAIEGGSIVIHEE